MQSSGRREVRASAVLAEAGVGVGRVGVLGLVAEPAQGVRQRPGLGRMAGARSGRVRIHTVGCRLVLSLGALAIAGHGGGVIVACKAVGGSAIFIANGAQKPVILDARDDRVQSLIDIQRLQC